MKKLTVIGPCIPWDGYGNLLTSVVLGLPKEGYDPEVIPTWTVQRFGTPDEVLSRITALDDKKGSYSLYICDMTGMPMDYDNDLKLHFAMWEASKLKRGFVPKMNSNLCIIVPSKWNKQVFEDSGVKAPVAVVQLGIDIKKYAYTKPKKDGPFTFAAGGNVSLGGAKRKRLHEVVKIFVRAFPSEKDVALRIKANEESGFPRYTDPRIRAVAGFLTEDKMLEWYRDCNVMVSISSAEGWGLMSHKAMCVGRPCLMPEYGGVTEYFDTSVGLPLAYKVGPATGYYASTEGEWAYYDESDLIEKMRWCRQNPEKVFKLGKRASERASAFSAQSMMAKLKGVLDYYIK